MKKCQKIINMSSRRFNDESYIIEYNKTGAFPKIHNDVGFLIGNYANEPEPSLDLGSNIGMICARSIKLGRSIAIGIEGCKEDFSRAVKDSRIIYENFYITRETFPRLINVLKKHKPTLVTARRVLSEIGIKDPSVVTEMAGIFHQYGVEKFIVEGRVPVKNPVVSLYNSELEVQAISNYFEVKKQHKAAYYLEAL
jgi:hypothetical protein